MQRKGDISNAIQQHIVLLSINDHQDAKHSVHLCYAVIEDCFGVRVLGRTLFLPKSKKSEVMTSKSANPNFL